MEKQKIKLHDSERISMELFKSLPKDQIERVMKQDICVIEPIFMGFVDTYYYLSKLIPKHFTIFDFGCAYNPQNYYFKEHKEYFAIDPSNCEKFTFENTVEVNLSIIDFLKSQHMYNVNIKESFAICNFVPPWYGGGQWHLRNTFENLYIYYPHGGFNPMQDIFNSK